MHADHVMGLPGLLASMNLLGRKIPIEVFGPEDLEDFVKTIWHKTGTHLDFPINFNVVDATKQSVLLEMKSYKIQAFPTNVIFGKIFSPEIFLITWLFLPGSSAKRNSFSINTGNCVKDSVGALIEHPEFESNVHS